MTLLRPYSADGALPRPRTRLAADALVLVGMAVLFWLLIRLSQGVEAPFYRVSAPSTVSTDPANLPYYAARSLLRMFVALGGLDGVHVRLRDGGGAAAAGGEDPAADPGRAAVGAGAGVPVGDGDRVADAVPATRCWAWSARRCSRSSPRRRGT